MFGGISPLEVLRRRGFRLLWIGEAVSLLGDQFYMIALPWLVLQLTGDAFAMGTVLALAGIPRALFMLVGGAVTDRFSPRAVMLVSNLARMVMVALLSVLVFSGRIELWMLYGFGLLFGLADAFYWPAQNAIVPRLVERNQLEISNAIMQGTAQLSLFGGPVLAGGLIALLGNSASVAQGTAVHVPGIALAFAFDGLTFLVSAFTLWTIRASKAGAGPEVTVARSVLYAIREGLRYVWKNVSLRTVFLLIAVSNLLINGPVIVGIPLLAKLRFAQGAAAFGMIMSAYGGGSLLGTLLGGTLPNPSAKRLGMVLGAIFSGLGVGVVLLGISSTTAIAALVGLAMGAANGYVVILFVSWLQRNTPATMLGRMMSLMMFSSAGLLPVSTAITGAVAGLNPVLLFVGAGALMTMIVLLSMLHPALRALGTARFEVDNA